MGLEPLAQFKELVAKAEHVLILLPQNPSGDAIGSGFAVAHFLEQSKKKATLAFSDPFQNAERYHFLPRPSQITHAITGARDFVLAFNTKFNNIIDHHAVREENEFKIFITPEHGAIDPRDFSFIPAKFKYDLLVVIDAPDKDAAGKIYEQDPDIFYEIPVVNIDHHSTNDNFGQFNFVQLTASSTSEIVADLLESIDSNAVSQEVAKCLLTGIISATESFQTKSTTPKALQTAARLMEKGADQQEIIRWLYKTQPLHILKLWGRVMARLRWDESMKLAWSLVTIEDFVQSRSKSTDLSVILDRIKDNYSAGKVFLVLFNETPSMVRGILKSTAPEFNQKLANAFSNWKEEAGTGIFSFSVEAENIMEAENIALEELRTRMV